MIRGIVGKGLINNAFSSFNKIVSDLEGGIKACNDQKAEHTGKIFEHQSQVKELDDHIFKATQLKMNVEKIIS